MRKIGILTDAVRCRPHRRTLRRLLWNKNSNNDGSKPAHRTDLEVGDIIYHDDVNPRTEHQKAKSKRRFPSMQLPKLFISFLRRCRASMPNGTMRTRLSSSSSTSKSMSSPNRKRTALVSSCDDGGRDKSTPSLSLTCTSTSSPVDDHSISNTTNALHVGKTTRWAKAHPGTDLSGTWKPIITPTFLKEYDVYLQNCGTNFMFRQIYMNLCPTTRETIIQSDGGRIVRLRGSSPLGGWDRTLISSGVDSTAHSSSNDDDDIDEKYEVVYAEFLDPDREPVKVEAWWDEQGTVHHSFLRGKASVCGGEFESRRYLDYVAEGDGKVVELVCESKFHPSTTSLDQRPATGSMKFRPAFIQWRYRMA